ncbi:MAG: hypothetical protein COB38_10205 [Gammaproteobacteria bacterium]|nr:MAG: hypothetical protein COB38_10205 [Gammaproteobacteria bacterium]
MSRHNLPRNIQFIFEGDEFESEVFKTKSLETHLIVSEQVEKIHSLATKSVQIQPNQVNQFLGQEIHSLFYDAVDSFDVNQFIAIIGCLVGGGNLILRLPKFYQQMIQLSFNNVNQDLLITNQNHNSQLLLRFVRYVVTAQQNKKTDQKISNKNQSEQFNIEQHLLIKKIERCALGHAKRPLVITADRGRGKSTALAKASASLCYTHNKNIIITAPRKENLNIFFEQFNNEIEYLASSKDPQKTNNINDAKKLIQFTSIDSLLQIEVDHHFLIVDEAGSFPVQVLHKIILRFNRIAFASTVSGYEGNGRGFEIKFIPLLSKAYPQYRIEKLSIPYRWPSNDLLEDCCNKAFLLAQPSQPTYSEGKSNTPISPIKYQTISKENLLQNETLLTSVFSLLTEAHYQTRPSDLERMLSDPQLKTYVGIDKDKQVVSACLIVVEGQINNSDCVKISRGKLRIDGQLLPQSLISTKGIISAGELVYWRIMRIAVAPSLQNSLIGSNMIKYVYEQAKKQNIDILGTSFALNTSLFNFWNLLDFHCCRIALRTDSSTGLVPADFLLAISDAGRTCSDKATNLFNQSFIYSCSASYRNLDSSLLLDIMARQVARQLVLTEPEPITITADVHEIKSEVDNYIDQARSFEMVEWQISSIVQIFLSKDSDEYNQLENLDFVFAKIFQKHSWIELVSIFDLKGKNDAKKLLQECIQQIYDAIYRSNTLR